MIFETDGIKFNIDFFNSVENNKPILVFLHGFAGSSADWTGVAENLNKEFSSAGIDLIGHGKSSSPADKELYTADSIINQLYKIITGVFKRKIILTGYSMGGRAALSFAVKHSELLQGLILESATPGIEDEKLRSERVARDEEIAKYIETHTLEEFAEFWMDMEIFNTLRRFSEEKRKLLRKSRLNNNKTGLANSLCGFGTGRMPALYNQLNSIQTKTLLITGELDTKFTDINSKIVNQFKNAEHKIIKNSGHNTHLEETKRFIEVLNNFLKSF